MFPEVEPQSPRPMRKKLLVRLLTHWGGFLSVNFARGELHWPDNSIWNSQDPLGLCSPHNGALLDWEVELFAKVEDE